MAEALRRADGYLAGGGAHQIVTADASALVIAHSDPDFRALLNGADLTIPDSQGVVWAAQWLRQPVPERVPGVDLMEALCVRAAQRGLRVYFLGSAPGVAAEAGARLAERYPGFHLAGCHHGFFGPDEEPAIVEEIASLRPDLLFVAFGIPRQEKWIRDHQPRLQVPLAVGVGGSLDCFSGRVKRAPVWARRLKVEWAYRLATNPKKYKKGLMLPKFTWLVLSQGRGGGDAG